MGLTRALVALATALARWLAGSLLYKERLKITNFSKNGSASEPVSQTHTTRFPTSLEIAPWNALGRRGTALLWLALLSRPPLPLRCLLQSLLL